MKWIAGFILALFLSLSPAFAQTRMQLNWTASTDNVGVTGYNIYREGVKVGTSPTNSFIDTGLTPSTTYHYVVKAFDAAGNESVASNQITVTTLAGSACGPANTPGGADLFGGCYPGPNNTGPNAPQSSMAAYTGSCTISTANVIIDSKVINCSPLTVDDGANNLMIKNSYIKGGVVQSTQSASAPAFTIQDSFLDNAVPYPACPSGSSCAAGLYACGDPNNATVDCGIGYNNLTVLRTQVINSNRAAYCQSHCTIQDNYFHGTNLWPSTTNLAHASSVRAEQFMTLTHNTLACDYTGPFPNSELGCSADMSGYPDFAPIKNNTITNNLFMSNNVGAGFCIYGGGTAGKPFSSDPTNATNIVIQNNVFQKGANGKCGTFGPVTDFISGRTGNVWSGNVFDDGTTVPPQ